MISRISFNGQVHLVGAMQKYKDSSEVNEMRRYANDNDCDIVVLSKKDNPDGSGCYDVIVSTTNSSGQSNNSKTEMFDFFKKDGKLDDTKKTESDYYEDNPSVQRPWESIDDYLLRTDPSYGWEYTNAHLA